MVTWLFLANSAAAFGAEIACIAVAVAQEDENATFSRLLLQCSNGKANGVPDCGLAAGHTDGDLIEKALDRLDVIGQRRHQIGFLAEDDQPDPIALTALDEGAGERLDRREAINATTVELDVARFHAGGEIEC